MNDLSAPPVPQLSSDWVRAHRNQLLREIAAPQRRQVSRRLALGGIGALAVVGATAAAMVITFVGAGAPNAFAGWRATPTPPASGQTASALTECTSRLAEAAGGQSGIPAGGWQPVLTDTRGPFTAMILQSGSATASCLTGPSFTTTAANAAQGGESHHVLHESQHVLSGGSASAVPPNVSVMGLNGTSSGPISQASQQQLSANGQPYTLLQGQVEPDVTSITLALSDSRHVQATVADGALIAWWPGTATATTAHATSGSSVTTQHLTFTPISPPNSPPNAPASTSSSSSH
jgi:hypothetical protein